MHIHLSYFDLFLFGSAGAAAYWWFKVKNAKKNLTTASSNYTYGNTHDDYYVKKTGENPWSTTRNGFQPAPVTTTQYNTAPAAPAPVSQPTQTVVHEHYHGGSGGDMLTGVLVGEMLMTGGGRGGSTTVVNNNTVVEGMDHNNHDQSNYVDNGTWDSTPSTPSTPSNDNSSSGWDFSIGGSDSSSDNSSGFDVSIGSDC